jgi:hypothetical protein
MPSTLFDVLPFRFDLPINLILSELFSPNSSHSSLSQLTTIQTELSVTRVDQYAPGLCLTAASASFDMETISPDKSGGAKMTPKQMWSRNISV